MLASSETQPTVNANSTPKNTEDTANNTSKSTVKTSETNTTLGNMVSARDMVSVLAARDMVSALAADPGNLSLVPDTLLNRIIASDCSVISVQKDKPDPSRHEKLAFLKEMYTAKPDQFIYRYHSCLESEDIELFNKCRSDPTVNHYLDKLARQKKLSYKATRNRRYCRLQELLAEGVYFSDVEMRKRQPKLHYHMIGQFETDEEKEEKRRAELSEDKELKFSTFLLQQSDRQEYRAMCEEEEEDEDEDEEGGLHGSKAELIEEFRNIMLEKFLSGEDVAHVQYADIDNNEKYDDLKIRSRDAEDAYFDESEEEMESTSLDEDTREFLPPPLKPRQEEET